MKQPVETLAQQVHGNESYVNNGALASCMPLPLWKLLQKDHKSHKGAARCMHAWRDGNDMCKVPKRGTQVTQNAPKDAELAEHTRLGAVCCVEEQPTGNEAGTVRASFASGAYHLLGKVNRSSDVDSKCIAGAWCQPCKHTAIGKHTYNAGQLDGTGAIAC